MTAAERALLLAVFRWARAEGIQFGTSYRWTRHGPIEQRWGVSYDPGSGDFLTIWRGRTLGLGYAVTSVAEAIDVLVALGILPARFSTAYRAGYEARVHAGRIAKSLRPDSMWSRGWTDPEVYALLPVPDHELVRP